VQSGNEQEVQAWLDTVASEPASTVATIVPKRGDKSARRAAELLSQLMERGQPVELVTGKTLGEGGMGIVREAEQVALGRMVAVKTLKPGHPENAAALLREAWTTGSLEHPNIVPVHHLEIDASLSPLLILKRVDGVEWSSLVRDAAEVQRRFLVTDLLAWNLRILDRVLDALRFAHARGVIHRDLKPSNVMIGNFGEVYLLDWGLAVSLKDDGSGRFALASEATELAGTPCYLAPEMLRRDGDPALTVRTDVYLAGAVLYELIAGQPPHQGNAAVQVIASIIMSKPQLPADAPAELAAICVRAMHADPDERYASIEEMQLALRRYLDHRGASQLADSATARGTALRTLAAGKRKEDREEIYRELAVARFAFHEALAAWRDNTELRAAMNETTAAIADYELSCGDPHTAVALLEELDQQHPLLATAKSAAAKRDSLAAIGREHDPTVHSRTRTIAVGLGVAFTVLPAAAWLAPSIANSTFPRQLGWALGMLGVLTIFSLLNRTTTAINRRILHCGRFLFVAQAINTIGMWSLGVDPAMTQVWNLLLWGVLVGTFAIMIDPWLNVIALGYIAGFLATTRSTACCSPRSVTASSRSSRSFAGAR
jgi:hypothetical protein